MTVHHGGTHGKPEEKLENLRKTCHFTPALFISSIFFSSWFQKNWLSKKRGEATCLLGWDKHLGWSVGKKHSSYLKNPRAPSRSSRIDGRLLPSPGHRIVGSFHPIPIRVTYRSGDIIGDYRVSSFLYTVNPIGSMGLVYWRTFTIQIN